MKKNPAKEWKKGVKQWEDKIEKILSRIKDESELTDWGWIQTHVSLDRQKLILDAFFEIALDLQKTGDHLTLEIKDRKYVLGIVPLEAWNEAIETAKNEDLPFPVYRP